MASILGQQYTFPSEDKIIFYLLRHPKSAGYSAQDSRIIRTIAEVFADSEQDSRDVKRSIEATLDFLNEDLLLSHDSIVTVRLNLTEALKDCATGKPIELERTTAS